MLNLCLLEFLFLETLCLLFSLMLIGVYAADTGLNVMAEKKEYDFSNLLTGRSGPRWVIF